jgi:iron complex transport system substrate-binding protein
MSLSRETVASLEPDLVISNATGTSEALGPLRERMRVLQVPTDTLEDLLRAVVTVGKAVGREDAARALRGRMEDVVEAARLRGRKRAATRRRVLVVVQRDPFFVAGPGSYVDSLLEVLGWKNAAAGLGKAWPTISAEALLGLAPDAIVDAAPNAPGASGDTDAEARTYWSRYESLPAVKQGRIRRLRDDAAVRPGPALQAALEVLDASIAPEKGEGK